MNHSDSSLRISVATSNPNIAASGLRLTGDVTPSCGLYKVSPGNFRCADPEHASLVSSQPAASARDVHPASATSRRCGQLIAIQARQAVTTPAGVRKPPDTKQK
ncbi:MAG: hypothetical protein JNM43_04330 [Planctomycetaceae bacterium]|nr:hypothetical protein [Planctomycetaceae bacterium]